MSVFPEYPVFERIVAENGALLYDPKSKRATVLGEPPPAEFVRSLTRKGVTPLSVGRVLVATLEDQKEAVLQTIQELGLELQLIFNKGSIMVLPSGVNKATGLKAALQELCLSLHNTVGVGDAENDHAFLHACERAVSVANALPALKERSDLVTTGVAGHGVSELMERMMEDDLAGVAARGDRDSIVLGEVEGQELRIPYGATVWVDDTIQADKSALASAILKRILAAGYQLVAIHPEGDYRDFEGAVVLGESARAPAFEEILKVLAHPDRSLIVNLESMGSQERLVFFARLLPQLEELRARTGRPHWMVVDDAQHLVAAKDLTGAVLIRRAPERV